MIFREICEDGHVKINTGRAAFRQGMCGYFQSGSFCAVIKHPLQRRLQRHRLRRRKTSVVFLSLKRNAAAADQAAGHPACKNLADESGRRRLAACPRHAEHLHVMTRVSVKRIARLIQRLHHVRDTDVANAVALRLRQLVLIDNDRRAAVCRHAGKAVPVRDGARHAEKHIAFFNFSRINTEFHAAFALIRNLRK